MSPERHVEKRLAGWGGFPVETCSVYRPEKLAAVRGLLASGAQPSWIARGLGRSYGDTAVNAGAGVLAMERLDRMLAFDAATGVLECEAGVSLEEVIRVFLPRGWFPPVVPGTKFVTVGGAVANDIHGKNHHVDGTFGAFVLGFDLLLPSGEVLRCSREENPEVFRATLGGIGLTGVLLTVRFRLTRVESAWMVVDTRRVKDLEESMLAMEGDDDAYPYSVAWIDCLATGASLGRSVLLRGRHAAADSLPPELGDPRIPPVAGKLAVPFQFPAFALNRYTVAAFNEVYYRAHPDAFDQLVDLDAFFFPLDSIHHWNRIYGRRGFVQYQCVLAPDVAQAALTRILERLAATGHASFLAVLKRFGPQGEGMLSFPRAGYTLSLDIPMTRDLPAFLEGLDRVVLEHGGRLYLGKDALMSPATFEAGYPEAPAFREVKARLDPGGRLASSQARRIGLVAS